MSEIHPCSKSSTGYHEPDWTSVKVQYDGEEFIDIVCKHCGKKGCLGTKRKIEENMTWED
jgi:hypothetical protein